MSPNFFRQITQIRPSVVSTRRPFTGSTQQQPAMLFSTQAGRYLSILLMILVMLIALLGTQLSIPAYASAPLTVPERQLQAGPTVEWARWILDLDFSKPDFATWRLVAGYDNTSVTPAQPVVLQEIVKDITASCRFQGSAHIDQREAIFDGAGYLACDLPSFVDELAALQTGLPLMGDCRCVNPDPFIYADLTLDRQLIGHINPLFHEDSFRFSVPWVGKRTAASRWWLDGQWVPDHVWRVDSGGNALFAGVGAQYFMAGQTSTTPINQPALAATIQATPNNHFLQWADSATANHFGWTSTFQMTTEETTVYIGYDPNTNAYFKGRLRQLVVDPPCKSN